MPGWAPLQGADALLGFLCSLPLPFHGTWESGGPALYTWRPSLGKGQLPPVHSGRGHCLASMDSGKAPCCLLKHFSHNENPGNLDHNLWSSKNVRNDSWLRTMLVGEGHKESVRRCFAVPMRSGYEVSGR